MSGMQEQTSSITALIQRARGGDEVALDHLFRLIYPDLKRLAKSILSQRARVANAPSATTLIHNACRRILEREALEGESRRHFFRLFCRAMEDEWVERARHDLAQKRQPTGSRQSLDDLVDEPRPDGHDFTELREALQALAAHDAQAAEVVALRFYCSAGLQETAEITGSTLAIVRRNLDYGKAWLHERLSRGSSHAQDDGPG